MGTPTADVLTNLISAWSGNGTVFDSLNADSGILEGGLTYGAGLNGLQCFVGNGTNAYVTTLNSLNPTLLAGGAYSFSAWINTTSLTGFPIVYMDSAQTTTSGIYDKLFGLNNSGNLYWAIFNGSTYALIYTGKSCNDGLWHHVVVTSNNSNVSSLFIDGTFASSGLGNGSSYSGYWKMGMNHWVSYPIGTVSSSDPFYFNGKLQDLRYYGAVLTPTQVATLYGNGPRVVS